MNRKELIDKAALEYANKSIRDKGIVYLEFIEAVEWADRTMIDKACEKLKSMFHTLGCGDHDCVGHSYITVEEFLEVFKKYMEE